MTSLWPSIQEKPLREYNDDFDSELISIAKSAPDEIFEVILDRLNLGDSCLIYTYGDVSHLDMFCKTSEEFRRDIYSLIKNCCEEVNFCDIVKSYDCHLEYDFDSHTSEILEKNEHFQGAVVGYEVRAVKSARIYVKAPFRFGDGSLAELIILEVKLR